MIEPSKASWKAPGAAVGARPRGLVRYSIAVAVALALSVSSVAVPAESPQDILVVVNEDSEVESVTEEDLRDVFLRRRMSWHGGKRAIPINAREGTAVREAFRKRVLGMNADEETRYWQDQQIRSGKTPPKEFGNPQRAVFKLHDAVCYTFRSDYKEAVGRIVLVVHAD
ncbi:MAG: hypothetical protein R6V85_02760 [Polyangia bacterium]